MSGFGWFAYVPGDPEGGASDPSPAVAAVEAHLGVPLDEAVLISAHWPVWQQASVQRAMEAYLAEAGSGADWAGLSTPHREHQDILELLRFPESRLTKPVWTQAPVGPAELVEALDFGMVATVSPDGTPLILTMRRSLSEGVTATVEFLAADRHPARDALSRFRGLVEELDVLRGQVLSLGMSEHYGNELVTFMPRPELAVDQVILPDGCLDRIKRHIVEVGERADVLRDLGVHLRRGLLLHGPPGTGKTHTIRHLIGETPATVVIMSGGALHLIAQATTIARRLQPAIVVLEDVDLVARDRSQYDANPLLFALLDAMDGIDGDADVTFILTTNRVEELEEALVERPGRVDLAVEIPVPDAAGRRRLMDLYRGSVPIEADTTAAVNLLDGATASAIKEVMRRCVLRSLREAGEGGAITQTQLDETVADFTATGSVLTRRLLGGPAGDDLV